MPWSSHVDMSPGDYRVTCYAHTYVANMRTAWMRLRADRVASRRPRGQSPGHLRLAATALQRLPACGIGWGTVARLSRRPGAQQPTASAWQSSGYSAPVSDGHQSSRTWPGPSFSCSHSPAGSRVASRRTSTAARWGQRWVLDWMSWRYSSSRRCSSTAWGGQAPCARCRCCSARRGSSLHHSEQGREHKSLEGGRSLSRQKAR